MRRAHKCDAKIEKAPALRKDDYTEMKPIYGTVDTSPTGIGWVINQEGEGNVRYAVRFGAKVLNCYVHITLVRVGH